MTTCTKCMTPMANSDTACPSCSNTTVEMTSNRSQSTIKAASQEEPAAMEPGGRKGDETPQWGGSHQRLETFGIDEIVSKRYKIMEEIGRGSYGIVYKAFDLSLTRKVALKKLRNTGFDDPSLLLELFYKEVKIAQELAHPNLCSVYDVREDRGRHYFTMAYAEGQDLRRYLAQKKQLDRNEIIDIASQLCKGLDHLHKKKLLHRDLKPENIIRGYDGRILITDFGLVELVEKCQNGLLVGTRPYIAPETLQEGKSGKGGDLYALGVILYELATGKLPFTASRISDLVNEIEKGPVPPSALVDYMDPRLEKIMLSCLSFGRGSRPSSVGEIELWLADINQDSSYLQNPFVSDRAVRGARFLGNARENSIKTILGRIAKRESTFIVGDLRTGKTSFLLRLADRIESGMENVIVQTYSLQSAPESYRPADFWNEALEPVAEKLSDSDTAQVISSTIDSGFTQTRLDYLLSRIFEKGYVLVLLLDEFEFLLRHPNFPPTFFAVLKTLFMSTNRALVIVPTSRFPLKETERRSFDLKLQTSSSNFKFITEIDLGSLDKRAADDLLSLSGPHFTNADRLLIRTLAGRQPYLLQMFAEILFSANSDRRWSQAASRFYDKILFYLDDLWEGWSDGCRSATVLLLLAEWSHRIEENPLKVTSSDLSRNEFRVGLRELARAGLLEEVDEVSCRSAKHTFEWEGKNLSLGPEVFAWWFRDLAILKTRSLKAYSRWLSSTRRQGVRILEDPHLDRLRRLAKIAMKKSIASSIGDFMSEFSKNSSDSL